MAASQACEMVEDKEVNAFVVPTKTIPQGIGAATNFDEEAKPEENLKAMKSGLKEIKSGEVTFAIRDTEINGVKIKKDHYIAIHDKEIITDNEDRFTVVKTLVDELIDEDSSLLLVLVGEDVTDQEMDELNDYCSTKYPLVELDLRKGGQAVYSYLLGVE